MFPDKSGGFAQTTKAGSYIEEELNFDEVRVPCVKGILFDLSALDIE